MAREKEMKLTDLEAALTDSKGEFSPRLEARIFDSTHVWVVAFQVMMWRRVGRPFSGRMMHQCPMLLKPTSFEVTYFWITYVSLTSCRLGGSIKYGNSETDLLRIRSANVYPGFRSSLESLQFSELHKGKFPDRNCIGPVVHFPGDWYEIRVCERHNGCVEARCNLT